MHKLLSVSIIIFMLAFSRVSFACFPAKIPLEKRVSHSTHIAVGFVTGKHLNQFEEQVGSGSTTIQPNEAFTLRVKVINNIKNQFQANIIYPIIANCGSGSGELKQKVFVFYDGEFWFVQPFDLDILNQLNKLAFIE